MSGPFEIAVEAWGHDMPEWVNVLAKACAASSQSKVAKRLGYAAAVVSQILRNKYAGKVDNVRARVEGVLMGATLECPALGLLPLHECQDWRKKAKVFSNANHQRVVMYRACSNCPNNVTEGS
ncbi:MULTISPECIES: hypothetical protein [unclassified Yoonia]|uniref:hypothetical protein n=1 Tax=unclassified Yoonia TaxID=2629118 RepID=UPI002AFF62AC|nr:MULTISPECIES: hypothetical protein [unclassified Yoonia]